MTTKPTTTRPETQRQRARTPDPRETPTHDPGSAQNGTQGRPPVPVKVSSTHVEQKPGHSWTVNIPAPAGFISLNQRQHWAAKARLTKAWREAAHVYAKQAQLPKELSRVHVEVAVVKATNRRYDVHNLMPTAKAVVDGLIDCGLCADDSNEYVIGPDMRVAGKGTPGLVVTVTEIG